MNNASIQLRVSRSFCTSEKLRRACLANSSRFSGDFERRFVTSFGVETILRLGITSPYRRHHSSRTMEFSKKFLQRERFWRRKHALSQLALFQSRDVNAGLASVAMEMHQAQDLMAEVQGLGDPCGRTSRCSDKQGVGGSLEPFVPDVSETQGAFDA